MVSEVGGASHADAASGSESFVMVARGVVVADNVLDLIDLAPSTIRIRWAGGGSVTYLSTSQFLDLWPLTDSHSVVATWGMFEASTSATRSLSLCLGHPRIVGSGLRWCVTGSAGVVPQRAGSCVLVINPPITAPLTLTSATTETH